jgi:hypothetical protein
MPSRSLNRLSALKIDNCFFLNELSISWLDGGTFNTSADNLRQT